MNPLSVYYALLKNELIPKEQIQDSNKSLFNIYNQQDYCFFPENEHIDTLKVNGYFETIKQEILKVRDDDFMWFNKKCDLIKVFIKIQGFDKEVTECIANMSISSYPSQWLLRELKGLFFSNPSIKAAFQNLENQNNLKYSTELQ